MIFRHEEDHGHRERPDRVSSKRDGSLRLLFLPPGIPEEKLQGLGVAPHLGTSSSL